MAGRFCDGGGGGGRAELWWAHTSSLVESELMLYSEKPRKPNAMPRFRFQFGGLTHQPPAGVHTWAG